MLLIQWYKAGTSGVTFLKGGDKFLLIQPYSFLIHFATDGFISARWQPAESRGLQGDVITVLAGTVERSPFQLSRLKIFMGLY